MTIRVEPDPPREGEPVTITVTGPGPYRYSVDGGPWTELPIDEETGSGSIVLPAGSGGTILDVTDGRLPNPDDLSVLITSSDE
ncbi:MAG TPA: hypothetical protein VK081_13505 [Planctomycetota bacterium]|nr:hypothetical protein [Planctomycetota bacterium]